MRFCSFHLMDIWIQGRQKKLEKDIMHVISSWVCFFKYMFVVSFSFFTEDKFLLFFFIFFYSFKYLHRIYTAKQNKGASLVGRVLGLFYSFIWMAANAMCILFTILQLHKWQAHEHTQYVSISLTKTTVSNSHRSIDRSALDALA